jgi:hypothetical protein
MIAAALVARLLADAGNDNTRSEALVRQLKQLQVLPAPGRLCVLTWEALDESLGFGAPVGDLIDAPTVGLVALGGPEISLQALAASITLRSEHKDRASGEPLRWKLHELSFDGKSFQVKVIDGQAG